MTAFARARFASFCISSRSMLRNIFPEDDLKPWRMFFEGSAANGACQQSDSLAGFNPRILVDHRVHGAREQQGLGILGQFVADEDDGFAATAVVQRLANAGTAAADIVDAGKVRVPLEQGKGL